MCVQPYHNFLGLKAVVIQRIEVKVNVDSAVFGCKVIEGRGPCRESSLMTLVCACFIHLSERLGRTREVSGLRLLGMSVRVDFFSIFE